MLTFPTQAERAIQAFCSRQFKSLAVACHKLGGSRETLWDCVEYTFDDDTTVRIRGRGRTHSFEAILP